MKKQNKSRQNKKTKNTTDGWNVQPNALTRIPRTVDRVIADRMITRLSYNGLATFSIAAATSTISKRWSPTGVYDVDPAIGGSTCIGFNEMAAFYNYYRAIRSSIRVKFANSTSSPVQALVIPLNGDPGGSPSSTLLQSFVNNPYSKIKMVPASGGPVTTLGHRMTTEKIFGSKSIYFDDAFASSVTTIPVNNWYWCVAILSPNTVGSQLNVIVEIEILIDVEFFGRKNLLN